MELNNVTALPEYADLDQEHEIVQREVERRVSETLGGVAVAIEAHYQRTQILRKALLNAPGSSCLTTPSGTTAGTEESKSKARNFVRDLVESGGFWKGSKEYIDGMKKVQTWKKSRGGGDSPPSDDQGAQDPIPPERKRAREAIAKHTERRATVDQDEQDYDLEQDVNAYLIQYSRKPESHRKTPWTPPSNPGTPEHVSQGNQDNQDTQNTQNTQATASSRTSTSSSLRGDRLHPVHEDLNDHRFKGRFPGQRLAMHFLLEHPETGPEREETILSKHRCDQTDSTKIRYFHLPSNNMEVCDSVPRALAGDYSGQN